MKEMGMKQMSLTPIIHTTPETILGTVPEPFQERQKCAHTELCKPFHEN